MQETVVFLSPRKQKKQAFEETKNMQIVKDTDTAISHTVWLKELKPSVRNSKLAGNLKEILQFVGNTVIF